MRRKKQIQNTDIEEITTETTDRPDRVQRRVNCGKFATVLHEYPNHDGTVIYVWRIKPEIDRKLVGIKDANIQQLRHPYPQDLEAYLTATHGGGEYKLQLNDANKDPSPVCWTVFEIKGVDPILNPAELVRGSADTEQLIRKWQMQGKIGFTPEGQITTVSNIAETLGAAERLADKMSHARQPDAAEKASVDLMADTTKKLVQFTLDQAKPADMSTVLAIAKELKGGGGETAALMTMVTAMMQQNTELLTKLIEIRQPKQEPAIDSALNLVMQLSDKFGIAMPGAGRSWVNDLGDVLAKIGPSLIGAYAMSKMGMPGMMPAAAPALQPAATTTAPSPAPPPAEQPNPQQAAALQHTRQIALQVLNCIDRRQSGEDFAFAFETMYGPEAYSQLAALEPEQIVTAIRMFPDLAPRIEAAGERLATFIEEFRGYATKEENDGDATA